MLQCSSWVTASLRRARKACASFTLAWASSLLLSNSSSKRFFSSSSNISCFVSLVTADSQSR